MASALRTGSPSERRSASSTSEATSANRLAHDLIEALAEQRLGRVIDVVDPALRVDRDDALAHRIERHHARAAATGPSAAAVLGSISKRGQQQRRLAGAVDQGARQLDAGDFAVRADELDLVALGRGLAGQPPAQVVLHQLDIFRRDEVGQRSADHIGRARCPAAPESARSRTRCACGEPEPRRAPSRPGAETAARGRAGAAPRCSRSSSSSLTAEPNCSSASDLPSSPMRAAAPASRVSCADLLRKFADRALLAPLPNEEHTDAHGQNS